jgi:hypothetical protein
MRFCAVPSPLRPFAFNPYLKPTKKTKREGAKGRRRKSGSAFRGELAGIQSNV